MRYLLALTLAAVIATASTAATAETSGGSDTPKQQCAMGYVTGVGGSAQSVREYLAKIVRSAFADTGCTGSLLPVQAEHAPAGYEYLNPNAWTFAALSTRRHASL